MEFTSDGLPTNGTRTESNSEGILIVTAKNKQMGTRQGGIICADMYDRRSSKYFCQHYGYANGNWENNFDYVDGNLQ